MDEIKVDNKPLSMLDFSLLNNSLQSDNGMQHLHQNQDYDIAFSKLHSQLADYQRKMFFQVFYTLQQEYKEKLSGKTEQYFPKHSQIYIKALQAVEKLDKEIHIKRNNKIIQKMADSYIDLKERQQLNERSFQELAKQQKKKIQHISEINSSMRQFLKDFGEMMKLRQQRFQLLGIKEKIQYQRKIFESKKDEILKSKEQYYHQIQEMAHKIHAYKNQMQKQLKKLNLKYKDLVEIREKQQKELKKLDQNQRNIEERLNYCATKTSLREMQFFEKKQNTKSNQKTNETKSHEIQKNDADCADKIYIRPQSQILFDQRYVHPQVIIDQQVNSNIQTQNTSKTRQNSQIKTSIKDEIKSNLWLILILFVLTMSIIFYRSF